MIRNERQYKITKTQTERFRKALDDLLANSRAAAPADSVNDQLKRKLQEDALRSQLTDLQDDLREYENLQRKPAEAIEVESLEELPDILVKARIAAGLTQKGLAEKLGLKEQQVQRYEATNYGGASLQRIQEVVRALGVKIRKQAFIPSVPVTPRVIFDRLGELGLSADFVQTKLFSSRLRASLDRQESTDHIEALVLNSAARISKIFNWDVPQLFTPAQPLQLERNAMTVARFKLPAATNKAKMSAYTVYAHYLALLTLHATPHLPPRTIPASWRHVRQQVTAAFGEISLRNIVNYIWDLGIPILPLKDSGHFHAATWRVRGRNVIVLKQKTQSEARWIIDLLHELWHAAQSPELPEHGVIEANEICAGTEEELIEEQIATDFAADVVFKGKADQLADECADVSSRRMEWLKSAVQKVAAKNDVRVDLLASYLAYRLSLEGQNWWGTASTLQTTSTDPWQEVRDFIIGRIGWDLLSAGDRELLSLALQSEV